MTEDDPGAEFLSLFGDNKTLIVQFVKGFKGAYKLGRGDIMGPWGIPHVSLIAFERIQEASKSKEEGEKAKLIGECYGFSLAVIDFGLGNPNYWNDGYGMKRDIKSQIAETLGNYRIAISQ